jgi:uncharacterized protein YdbL (DUF1318 family)
MITHKKIGGIVAISMLTMALSSNVFADTADVSTTPKIGIKSEKMGLRAMEKGTFPQGRGQGQPGKMDEEKLAKLAEEKGITVEELKAQMEKEREAKLADMAKEKGITVEELKAQMQMTPEERLAKLAEEKGITVEELKAQMEKEREDKLAELAEEKGITVEELKAEMGKNFKGDKKDFRGAHKAEAEEK